MTSSKATPTAEPAAPRPRTALLVAAGIAVALTVIAVRVALDGRAALAAGDAAAARGDRDEAIRHWLDAGRSYVPWGGSAAAAVAKLDALAAQAQAEAEAETEPGRDLRTARGALEAIRAALLGTRALSTPQAARLADVDRRLAVVYALAEDPGVDPGATHEARVAWHAARLARRPGPDNGYVLMALGGLALWVGGVVGFVRRGLDAGLRLRKGPAIAAGVVFVIGFALFLTGLRLA